MIHSLSRAIWRRNLRRGIWPSLLVGLCFLVPWLAGGALAEAEDRRLGDDTATVRGLVWQDLDEDGQLTQGEPGLAGALLVLADENGAFLAYTHSGAAGEYRFDNLAPGVYLLFENDPASYGSTTPNKVRIALSPGEVATIDFGDGFFLSGCFRNVAGTVWHDADLDNRQEAGEVGLDGLIVRVVDLAGEVQGLTISEQGRYALRNLPAARYHVSFIPLAS
ncbi:MAG: hypothetical protein H5T69_02890, partial [Chloroflexi bacterium]|nr:hypothetical protein [Chloroflexota bacterium]